MCIAFVVTLFCNGTPNIACWYAFRHASNHVLQKRAWLTAIKRCRSFFGTNIPHRAAYSNKWAGLCCHLPNMRKAFQLYVASYWTMRPLIIVIIQYYYICSAFFTWVSKHFVCCLRWMVRWPSWAHQGLFIDRSQLTYKYVCLECGRNLGYTVETHTSTGRICKLQADSFLTRTRTKDPSAAS